MNRRSFIKISSLSAVALTIIPSIVLDKKEDKAFHNAVISTKDIFFDKEIEARVDDCFMVADNDMNVNTIILTNHIGNNVFDFVSREEKLIVAVGNVFSDLIGR